MYFLGRQQCRAAPFATAEKPELWSCSKHYQVARKSFPPQAFIICCSCAHAKVLGFVVLNQREEPPALIIAIFTRFAKLLD